MEGVLLRHETAWRIGAFIVGIIIGIVFGFMFGVCFVFACFGLYNALTDHQTPIELRHD